MRVIAVVLALLDLAPVFFLALGLFFLAQLVERLDPRSRRMALAGLALVSTGAFARAVSNVAYAITDSEFLFLSTLIYVFGAPGFALVAEAITRCWMAASDRQPRLDPWLVPMVVSWTLLLAAYGLRTQGDLWKVLLGGLFLGSSLLTSMFTALLGWKRRLHMAAGLLAAHFAGTVVFVLARALGAQNQLILAFAELIHLAAQMAFAFAAWRVAAEYQARVGPPAGK